MASAGTAETIGARTSTPQGAQRSRARVHLYELDMLRVVTAFAVVGVHVLAFTVIYTSQVGVLIQHGAEASLHFTREVFMFTTALVLVYTYAGKRFDLKSFMRKRGIGVVVPYAIWTVIYILIGPHPSSLPQLLQTAVHDLITGNASYQLYYILLTIQFYVLFPLLLLLLPFLDRHRRLVLGVSAALEVLILVLDYHVLQVWPTSNTHLGAWLNLYQSRFVLIYQFYFVLGALCALHLDRLRAVVLRHGKPILAALAAMLVVYWAHYAYALAVAHAGVGYAISVLQPIMLPYSIAVIAGLAWISCRWASRAYAGIARGVTPRPPAGSHLWRTLADASFGIYLVHPLFITFAMDHVVPFVPDIVPEPLRVALVWVVAVAGSSALSIALMRTPVLSRLVGRVAPMPQLVTRVRTAITTRLRSKPAVQRSRSVVNTADAPGAPLPGAVPSVGYPTILPATRCLLGQENTTDRRGAQGPAQATIQGNMYGNRQGKTRGLR